jgi:hypothetical protein
MIVVSANAQSNPKVQEIVIVGVAGFQDTPMQPDGKWHVHDPARPQLPVVTPGESSQNAQPPSDAVVLFNGKDLSHWRDKDGNPGPWRIEDGVLISQKTDVVTTNQFGDIQLHLEFRKPNSNGLEGQGRGNSGVFLMGKYEIQVLDCYKNKLTPTGQPGQFLARPAIGKCLPSAERMADL